MQSRRLVAMVLICLGGSPDEAAADSVAPGQRPTDQEVEQVVRRLLGKDVKLPRCQVVPSGSSYLIECNKTECGTCNVTYVVTTLRQKKGQWAVVGTRRERHGDTGECGCCM